MVMGMRQKLMTMLDNVQVRAAETAERTARNRRAVDAVLVWALERAQSAGPLHYPVEYVQLLRDCTERSWAVWREIRSDVSHEQDPASQRFANLIESLGDLPAVEFSSAERLGRVADRLRANVNPETGVREHGDQHRYFSRVASLGMKGRVLHTVARVMQSVRVVELGTSRGISALFLLEALETAGPAAHLTTVESTSDFHRRASALIHSLYDGRATCINGTTEDVVPKLARTLSSVDLMLHASGHSGDAFARDFVAAERFLAPGSVVLFDDIRWYDPPQTSNGSKCYDGWMEVTRHSRVRRAGEIDGHLGAVLLH